MSKLDLQNMDFCPPRKWLAVHKETGKDLGVFEFSDVRPIDGKPCLILVKDAYGLEVDWVVLELCHLCGFTGYCDSKGEDVYGGHLVEDTERGGYGVVCWRKDDAGWFVSWFNHPVLAGSRISSEDRIIGHIHQPDRWPDEVRRLLKGAEDDG